MNLESLTSGNCVTHKVFEKKNQLLVKKGNLGGKNIFQSIIGKRTCQREDSGLSHFRKTAIVVRLTLPEKYQKHRLKLNHHDNIFTPDSRNKRERTNFR